MAPIYEKAAGGAACQYDKLLLDDAGTVYEVRQLYEKAVDGSLYEIFSGRTVYAAIVDSTAEHLYLYKLGLSDGGLSSVGNSAIQSRPEGVAMLESGGSVYVGVNRRGGLRLYTMELSNGSLSTVGDSAFINNHENVALLETGGTAYAAFSLKINNQFDSLVLYIMDLGDGSLTGQRSDQLTTNVTGIAMLESGSSIYLATVDGTANTFYLHTLDLSTANLTLLGSSPVTSDVQGVSLLEIDGQAYAATVDSTAGRLYLYTLDLADGSLAAVANATVTMAPSGVALLLV